MKEIEVKILDINKELIESRLVSIGAKKTLDQTNALKHVYNPKIAEDVFEALDVFNKMADNSSRHAYLRIRKEGKNFDFTFKFSSAEDRHSGITTFEECSYNTDNIEEIDQIKTTLTELGLHKICNHEKHRTRYTLDSVIFDIDTWPVLPTYLEIEALDSKIIEHYIVELGLENQTRTHKHGSDLFKMYGYEFWKDYTFNV
jgi:adenylate cyclase class 2